MTEIDITNEPRSLNFKDRTGQIVSKLTIVKLYKIVKYPEYKKPNGAPRTKVYWECQCECGNICIKGNDVLNNTKRNFSCGCYRKERILETKLKTDEEHLTGFLKTSYARYRCEAKQRNYSFEITFEQFRELVEDKCFYCQVGNSQYMIHPITKLKQFFCGVDRIDNRKGYVYNNVITCCKKCNTKKNSIDPEMVIKLYNLMKDKGIINV